jgi:hypothetical protein
MVPDPRPEWVERLLSELAESDGRAERVTNGLSKEQLNWRPCPGKWSIGQCLEHLRSANDVYLPAIRSSLRAASRSSVSKILVPWPSRWFIRNYIAPNPGGARAQAPKALTPTSEISGGILKDFLASNARARELVLIAAAYDVNRIRFRNPLVPFLRFTVGTGLEIVSKHESRHLFQAEAVRSAANFPG